jgi:hypothetical protein
MTGNIPFAQSNYWTIVPRIVSGERPERPQISLPFGLTDAVWDLARQCWSQRIDERPVIADVLQSLNHATKYWEPPSSPGELLETDGGFPNLDSETSRIMTRGGGNATETSSSSFSELSDTDDRSSTRNPKSELLGTDDSSSTWGSESELSETDDGSSTWDSESETRRITSHSGRGVTEPSFSVWVPNTITGHPQHSFDSPRATDRPFSSLPLPNSKVCSVS